MIGGWTLDFPGTASPETGTDGYLGTYPCTHVSIYVPMYLISLPIEGSLPPPDRAAWHRDRTRPGQFGHFDFGSLGAADSGCRGVSPSRRQAEEAWRDEALDGEPARNLGRDEGEAASSCSSPFL